MIDQQQQKPPTQHCAPASFDAFGAMGADMPAPSLQESLHQMAVNRMRIRIRDLDIRVEGEDLVDLVGVQSMTVAQLEAVAFLVRNGESLK